MVTMGVRTVFIGAGVVLTVMVVVVVAAVGIMMAVGNQRWQNETAALHCQQDAGARRAEGGTFDPAALSTLPDPVQSYLETVLTPGQRMVAAVQIEHSGTFNMDATGENWRPFRSTQRVLTQRPSFVWDGRVNVMPGMNAHVHDAYVDGRGILYVALWGLVPVVDIRDTPEIARGELMRHLAETAWYPTALLPGQGVTWSAVDQHSADATLTDGDTTVTLRFLFGSDNLIERVYTEERDRSVGDSTELTPWDGRFTNYHWQDGMLVPMHGDVGWILPAGRLSYWRGHVEQVSYTFH
ncbi:MAG: hypothetical protein EA428_07260 [Spirochaetaceae bacterium]|nr:MAG: hypothetical protein EA428_07260 [Spirochaetaceae bacterium]